MEATIDREQMDTEVQTDQIMCVIIFFLLSFSLFLPLSLPLRVP